ncbi:hypothetical protein FRC12_016246, partial [Ceratobasidium sp. 428]
MSKQSKGRAPLKRVRSESEEEEPSGRDEPSGGEGGERGSSLEREEDPDADREE